MMKCDSEKKEAEDKRNATVKITALARASVARLQFRLPDGRTQSKQFPADTSLAEVYTFVESEVVEPTFGKFTLMMTFPRRQLDQEAGVYIQTLRIPKAALELQISIKNLPASHQ